MSNLQLFNFNENQIRVIQNESGEPWFVAADVCAVLEVGNTSQALSRLDDDERNTIILNDGIGNPQKSVVSESGLYSLTLSSRKPEAKTFKRWVTHEVLPSIRKHGGYLTPQTIEDVLSDPDTIIQLATKLKEERIARALAETEVKKREAVIEHLEPKAMLADKIVNSGKTVDITTYAKLIDWKPNKFFEQLRKDGYLYYRDGCNVPKQQYVNSYFVTKTVPSDRNGFYVQSRITGKGMVYLFKKYVDDPKKNAIGQQLMSFVHEENTLAVS